ncbi:MAG: ribulose-phosphate 3-epimerase [Phycisphaeraceae bacterium]
MNHTLLQNPPRRPLIFPSILGADFTRMGEECAEVLGLGAEGLHVDVMDGHFVPNLTMGPKMVADLRQRFPDVYLDVHLMVEEPERYVASFAEAGANCLTFHIEATLGRRENHELDLIEQVREAGCDVGVSLNPPTPAEAVLHLVENVDMFLVMSVNPGFSGQKFIADVLKKTSMLRAAAPDTCRIEMDGGIGPDTVEACREAGCDAIVAASALFNAADRAKVMQQLRGTGDA